MTIRLLTYGGITRWTMFGEIIFSHNKSKKALFRSSFLNECIDKNFSKKIQPTLVLT